MRSKLFAAALAGCFAMAGASAALAHMVPEVRPFAGAFIPIGDQRDVLKDTWMVGGQAGVELAGSMHALATLAWAANRGSHDPALFDYNAGLEAFRPFAMTPDWQFRPFVGAGLGARTYVDHGNGSHTETAFAGYGALGTEFQLSRIALRLEGRDYISRFKGLAGTDHARTANDLAFTSGVAIHW
jgi:hypothetical protein